MSEDGIVAEEVVQDSQATAESVLPRKESTTITLGGVQRTVSRMKAGKYYKCQRIFLEMLALVQNTEEKISSGESTSVTYWDILSVAPEKMMVFIASSLDMEVSELDSVAFPEEIPLAFKEIVLLNAFIENIKNFSAPMRESLGA